MIFFGDGDKARMSKVKDAVGVIRKVSEHKKEGEFKIDDITDRYTK